ncbi:ATP-dependent helicase HrpB [Nitratifractor sp.]
MNETLPIHSLLLRIVEALEHHGLTILQAEPGAGKSTVVPLELLETPWLEGQEILLLEPRRLAARMVATRLAESLGERVGERVGYRMRGETRVGPRTRIEVLTEGSLTRMLQRDPALEGVGLLIFDEFHERSLHADLGLALALQARELLRNDLRILVMSATLQSEELSALLGEETPLVVGEGRSHPVEIRHLEPKEPRPTPDDLPDRVAREIRRALEEAEGDLLAFLPGAREIRRCQRLLESLEGVEVHPLYGALDPAAQRRALLPTPPGLRKVILATNIAETSLTIPGIRIVVDGGYRREVAYDPALGMGRARTRPIALDSAAQRAGRAGRTAPGLCRRLWHAASPRPERSTPEILLADLAPLRLELARWGAEAGELRWIDPPPEAAMAEAEALLRRLEMLDGQGRITSLGSRALELGEHPRIAHMLLRAAELDLAYEGALLALLLSERPRLGTGTDLTEGLLALHRLLGESRADPRLRRRLEGLSRELGAKARTPRLQSAGLLVALAYPEKIALRRGEGPAYLAASGRGMVFDTADPLARHSLLAVAEAGGGDAHSRIRLAAPLSPEELGRAYPEALEERNELRYNDRSGRVEARRVRRYGSLLLESRPLPRPEGEEVPRILLEGIRRRGLEILPWDRESLHLRHRVRAARLHRGEAFPDWSDEALTESLEEWLLPYMTGMSSLEDLSALPMRRILEASLDWQLRGELDRLFPEVLDLPSGTRAFVDYSDPERPALEALLQETFGWSETPKILDGTLPLTLRLLTPARRPLALTRDLESFWREVYPEVRRELRGRYPKHHWPEDPLIAEAVRGGVKRGRR